MKQWVTLFYKRQRDGIWEDAQVDVEIGDASGLYADAEQRIQDWNDWNGAQGYSEWNREYWTSGVSTPADAAIEQAQNLAPLSVPSVTTITSELQTETPIPWGTIAAGLVAFLILRKVM